MVPCTGKAVGAVGLTDLAVVLALGAVLVGRDVEVACSTGTERSILAEGALALKAVGA